jgi:hypothetical protein
VYLLVMNAQADTDSRKTTEAVTNTDRFLRWKILNRSRNVGSFSGNVLNLLPLPTLKCMFRGPDNTLPVQEPFQRLFHQYAMPLRQLLRHLDGEQQCTSMCSGSNPALFPARPKVTVPLLYGDTTSVSYLSQDAIDGIDEAHAMARQ